MAIAPGTALSGIVLSATVRPRNAGAVGVSVLLLVSVRMGDLGFCTAGPRVSQAENLIDRLRSGLACLVHAASLPPLKEKQRASSMLARCIEKAFLRVLLQVRCSFCATSYVTTDRWATEPKR